MSDMLYRLCHACGGTGLMKDDSLACNVCTGLFVVPIGVTLAKLERQHIKPDPLPDRGCFDMRSKGSGV